MSGRDFHILGKLIGPICNLNCSHCYYLEKESLYPGNRELRDWILPDHVLESYIRQYIESQPHPTVSFAWQGGEPTLLGVEYFRKIASLQQKYGNGRKIENTLQTNGILLDDRWGDFLARNQFNRLISARSQGVRSLLASVIILVRRLESRSRQLRAAPIGIARRNISSAC